MLAYLSLLAMLSDWVCFFSAPIPKLVQTTYSNSLFAVTNRFTPPECICAGYKDE